MRDNIEKMVFSVDEAAMRANIGRDGIYAAIRDGRRRKPEGARSSRPRPSRISSMCAEGSRLGPKGGTHAWEHQPIKASKANGHHALTFLPAADLVRVLAAKLGGNVESTRRGWKCRCPAHADAEPSLALEDAASGVVLASCFPCGHDRASRDKLVAAIANLGYTLSPTRDFHSANPSLQKKKIVAASEYVDEPGEACLPGRPLRAQGLQAAAPRQQRRLDLGHQGLPGAPVPSPRGSRGSFDRRRCVCSRGREGC